jgi:predicted nuclease of restriction endonuclease-like RecB superfamily
VRIDGITRLPARLLSFTSADDELVPTWFGDRDRPWLRDLLDDAEALAGQPFEVWRRRWARGDPDPRAGRTRQRIAVHVLAAWLKRRSRTPPRSELRRTLFELGASGVPREAALAETAKRHGTTVAALQQDLYRDLPDQRPVAWPSTPPDAGAFAAAINLALVRGMLHGSDQVAITVRGGSRALLRTAWLLGMHVQVDGRRDDRSRIVWPSPTASATTDASTGASRRGPLSLVAMLPWCHRYRLQARCTIGGARGRLVVSSGDPIQPGPEPRRFDSNLERRFDQAFRREHPEWRVVREPCAVPTAHGLAFPDFSLQAPGHEPWLCEIAGLRDPLARAAKLALLPACPRLVLCLPRAAMDDRLRAHPRVVPFGRSVDAREVAEVVRRGSREA